jgi:hypothetical protein
MNENMHPGNENEGQGGGETVLPLAAYPDLQNAQEGQKVTLLGTVKGVDGESVTIGYDSVKLEENMADKAMMKMTGKSARPAMAPAGEDEDYA